MGLSGESCHFVVIRGGCKGKEILSTTFRGNYSHNIDAKGRICIPVRFREALTESFVVTKGFDGCLYAFAPEEWDIFDEKLRQLPLDNADARKLSRFFLGGAVDAEPDKQGRILLPQNLLDHADIKKEAVVVGVGPRLEIWSRERWDGASTFEDIEDIAQAMSTYGLRI